MANLHRSPDTESHHHRVAESPRVTLSEPWYYDSKALRDAITEQGAEVVIPPRSTSPQVPCDFALYCERNLIERFFLKIKHFRRIATRYEQTSRAFLSMLYLIGAFIWIR